MTYVGSLQAHHPQLGQLGGVVWCGVVVVSSSPTVSHTRTHPPQPPTHSHHTYWLVIGRSNQIGGGVGWCGGTLLFTHRLPYAHPSTPAPTHSHHTYWLVIGRSNQIGGGGGVTDVT